LLQESDQKLSGLTHQTVILQYVCGKKDEGEARKKISRFLNFEESVMYATCFLKFAKIEYILGLFRVK
jgi:hypothetical protein